MQICEITVCCLSFVYVLKKQFFIFKFIQPIAEGMVIHSLRLSRFLNCVEISASEGLKILESLKPSDNPEKAPKELNESLRLEPFLSSGIAQLLAARQYVTC